MPVLAREMKALMPQRMALVMVIHEGQSYDELTQVKAPNKAVNTQDIKDSFEEGIGNSQSLGQKMSFVNESIKIKRKSTQILGARRLKLLHGHPPILRVCGT